MKSIFRADSAEDAADKDLITAAQEGDQTALEALVRRHQLWIFNISVRMVGNPEDAQDVTQEILIKMIVKLSTFQQKSSFRTWLYRIVVNHILNRKRNQWERLFSRFERHADFNDSLENSDLAFTQKATAETELLVKETRSHCLTGVLLCLDRTQRMVFILGSILGINSRLGGEFLEISPENFRKILSRARKQLANFMDEKCGLINENNSCRCAAKTKACIEAGLVDPDHLRFNQDHVLLVKHFVAENVDMVEDAVDNMLEIKVQSTFRDQPLLDSPDFIPYLHQLLRRKHVDRIIDFNKD